MTVTKNLIKKGTENLRKGDFESALSFFEQALLLEPKNPDLWNQKGIALRSLGRYDEASECYNKSLELDPRDRASS
ncbi:tetratricopeptide repeat protein [Candidatus Nitrosopelagicus sp.]|nr:tetratricopeptide repeat protein [Candidatus Nitrosopelagicus sp.]